jgi:hypothetical protein
MRSLVAQRLSSGWPAQQRARAPGGCTGGCPLVVHHRSSRSNTLSVRTRDSATPRSGRADTVPVFETLITISSSATQSPEEQEAALSALWSLQYRVSGACCASAGPVMQSDTRESGGGLEQRACVYYRFSSQATAERFLAGSVLAEAKVQLLGGAGPAGAALNLALWKVGRHPCAGQCTPVGLRGPATRPHTTANHEPSRHRPPPHVRRCSCPTTWRRSSSAAPRLTRA